MNNLQHLTNEVWKDIPNYEGLYQASSLGRIYSFPNYCHDGKILKQSKGVAKKYLDVVLRKDLKSKTFFVHKLVAMAFLGHIPCGFKLVVDHIDGDPLNNKADNLQLITNRANSSKDKVGFESKYIGYQLSGNKWKALIRLERYQLHLGTESLEIDAYRLYTKALKKYESDVEYYKENISTLTYSERRKYLLNK